jgi:hypothetical protein
MIIEPLTAAHVLLLEPQPAQAELPLHERVELALRQADAGQAWAVCEGLEVLGIGGVIADPGWPYRWVVWALLSKHVGPRLLQLTRLTRSRLDAMPFRRLELYVDAQFPPGCRWARQLGFKLETPEPMAAFLPNGNGAYLFGRVL